MKTRLSITEISSILSMAAALLFFALPAQSGNLSQKPNSQKHPACTCWRTADCLLYTQTCKIGGCARNGSNTGICKESSGGGSGKNPQRDDPHYTIEPGGGIQGNPRKRKFRN